MRRVGGSWVALALVYAVAAVVHGLLATQHELSDLFPDEMFYAKLSQSFADGNGLEWRGSGWELVPLWPVVLSLAWHVGSTPDGYEAAKLLGTLLACSTVVPVWLLGRELVGPRLALIPAALAVTGAWMTSTSYLISENLAYPLAVASLACTVMAVRRPGATRWIVGAIAFGLIGASARAQLLAMPVILVVALVLDVLRRPRTDWRARMATRPLALWVGLVVAVVALLLAFVVFPRITNYDLLASETSVGDVIDSTGRQVVSSFTLFAFIPVAAVIALMARRAHWRDDDSGPLLVTILAAALVMFPLVGRFIAYATDGKPIDRYVMYLAPLFLIAMLLVPGRVGLRTGLAAAAAVVLALLATPTPENFIEQPGVWGAMEVLDRLGGSLADDLGLGLLLVALPLTVGGMLALTSADGLARLAVPTAIVAAVMVAQLAASQNEEIDLIREFRSQVAPPQLDWVDRRTDERVAVLNLGKPQQLRGNIDLYTDFFNRRVTYLYANVPSGGECRIKVAAGGRLAFDDGGCERWPRHLVVQEGPFRVALAGQRVLATTPVHGRLVRIPEGTPRVLAMTRPPCRASDCTGELTLQLYLDRPGRVTVRFGPAAEPHRIRLGRQVGTTRPNAPATLRFPVARGDRTVRLPVDWRTPDAAPALESVVLTEADGNTTRVY